MAAGHAMEYYLSLPHGWAADKKWPVVIVIESAKRQFQETAEVFENARKGMPFIIAVSLVIRNADRVIGARAAPFRPCIAAVVRDL